jgi:putative nucleotidyltransferase with HDIG domain
MRNIPARRRTSPSLLLALGATAIVALVPAVVAWGLRASGSMSPAPAVGVAAIVSIVMNLVGAQYWQRRRRAGGALFNEVMLWGWGRQRLFERRLGEAITVLGLQPDGARHTPIALSMERRVELFRQLAAGRESSDPYTHGHSRRVARYASLMGAEMGLSREDVKRLGVAALLHDVGKLYTPCEILHKPTRLTEEEFAVIRRHAVDGARMIRLLLADDELAAIVLHHHERVDGTGYPSGLSGELIPLAARIIAVADTFDAITSKRPYRPAKPHRVALDVLRREAGHQLDARAVKAFLAVYSGREPIAVLAAISAGAEAVLPSLAAAGAQVAAVAAGTAALATGGLALASAAQSKTAHVGAKPPVSLFATARLHHRQAAAALSNVKPAPAQKRSHPRGRGHPSLLPRPRHPVRPGTTSGGSPAPVRGRGGGSPPDAPSPGPVHSKDGGGGSPAPGTGPGGNGVGVTTGGSGAGVGISQAGASAGANVDSSTATDPTVGGAVGTGSVGVNASGSPAGGVSAGATPTPPGSP